MKNENDSEDDRSMILRVTDEGNGKIKYDCQAHSQAAALFNDMEFVCGIINKSEASVKEALAMTALDMISTSCDLPLKRALSLQFLSHLTDEGLTHNPDDDKK